MTDAKTIAYGRQEAVVPQDKAAEAWVTVFGCGTVGSNAAVELARMGVKRFHLADFDEVEAHNVPSQRFTKHDIGRTKVSALRDQVESVGNDVEITETTERVEGPVLGLPSGVAILAVDSMESRRKIYETLLRGNHRRPLVLDFRMAGNLLQCFAFDPNNTDDQGRYESSLFDDADADETPCGGRTVSYTGALAGCMAANYTRMHLAEQEVPYMTAIDLGHMDMQVIRRG